MRKIKWKKFYNELPELNKFIYFKYKDVITIYNSTKVIQDEFYSKDHEWDYVLIPNLEKEEWITI